MIDELFSCRADRRVLPSLNCYFYAATPNEMWFLLLEKVMSLYQDNFFFFFSLLFFFFFFRYKTSFDG